MNKADYDNLYVDHINNVKMQRKAKKRAIEQRRMEDIGFCQAMAFGTIFWTMFIMLAVWTYK